MEKQKVKELGEQIGYGNLMTLASELWRKSLKKQGVPEDSAFVAICKPQDLTKVIDSVIEMAAKDYSDFCSEQVLDTGCEGELMGYLIKYLNTIKIETK